MCGECIPPSYFREKVEKVGDALLFKACRTTRTSCQKDDSMTGFALVEVSTSNENYGFYSDHLFIHLICANGGKGLGSRLIGQIKEAATSTHSFIALESVAGAFAFYRKHKFFIAEGVANRKSHPVTKMNQLLKRKQLTLTGSYSSEIRGDTQSNLCNTKSIAQLSEEMEFVLKRGFSGRPENTSRIAEFQEEEEENAWRALTTCVRPQNIHECKDNAEDYIWYPLCGFSDLKEDVLMVWVPD